MLDSQSAGFAERVWEVASQLGNNAPKIADDMMEDAFPLTCTQARQEGALRMLRTGIITEVKRILRTQGDAVGQADFADVCEAFAPLVKDLRSKSYFVESAEEYVAIPDLITAPGLLDDARKFMRRKGMLEARDTPFNDLDAKAIAQGSAAFTTIKEWFDAR